MGSRSWNSMSLQGLCMVGALELVWVLSLTHGASAQSHNCSDIATFAPLTPCLTYIQPGNTTTPASDCCDPLRSFLASSDSVCLCQIPSLAQAAGLSINETRAIEVATTCNRGTLPSSITSCLSTSGSAPVEAPSETPTASTSSTTPPPQAGGSPSLGSALVPPPFLLISSILVALSLHFGIVST